MFAHVNRAATSLIRRPSLRRPPRLRDARRPHQARRLRWACRPHRARRRWRARTHPCRAPQRALPSACAASASARRRAATRRSSRRCAFRRAPFVRRARRAQAASPPHSSAISWAISSPISSAISAATRPVKRCPNGLPAPPGPSRTRLGQPNQPNRRAPPEAADPPAAPAPPRPNAPAPPSASPKACSGWRGEGARPGRGDVHRLEHGAHAARQRRGRGAPRDVVRARRDLQLVARQLLARVARRQMPVRARAPLQVQRQARQREADGEVQQRPPPHTPARSSWSRPRTSSRST